MEHRLEMEIDIRFSNRWRSGSGEGNILVDRLIQLDARGLPFLPASTLKGVIRESCEKLSRTLDFPLPSNPHSVDLTADGVFEPLSETQSPVDRLFGNKFEAGGLIFRDARPADSTKPRYFFQTRTRMNRKLRTVRDQHLFASQYSMPVALKSKLTGFHNDLTLIEDTDPPFEYALLIAAIQMIDRIGGDKSTGAGYMRPGIRIDALQYNGAAMDITNYTSETLGEYLEADDYLEMRGVT